MSKITADELKMMMLEKGITPNEDFFKGATAEGSNQTPVEVPVEEPEVEEEATDVVEEEAEITEENLAGDISYRLQPVHNTQGEIKPREFSLEFLKAYEGKIDSVLSEFDKLNSDNKYSDSYKKEKKAELRQEVREIQEETRKEFEEHLEWLRNPVRKTEQISVLDEEKDSLRRLNNTIMTSTIVNSGDIDSMASLYHANPDNLEARAMIQAGVNRLIKEASDKEEHRKAIKLGVAIQNSNNELYQTEYFNEIDGIESNYKRFFSNPDYLLKYNPESNLGFEVITLGRDYK